MVLLDLVIKTPELRACKIVIAHVDHGIRKDSDRDHDHVKKLAESYGLDFESTKLGLGSPVSELLARDKRYKFLRKVMKKHDATALVIAHHQDDVLETMIINILRGTNRKGLTSLSSSTALIRPMLGIWKKDIIAYAQENSLIWHEDSTNLNNKYLRNYIRNKLIPRFSQADKQKLLDINIAMQTINKEIDTQLEELAKVVIIKQSKKTLFADRQFFILNERKVALELLKYIIYSFSPDYEVNARNLKNCWLFMKTARNGKILNLDKSLNLRVKNFDVVILEKI